MADNKLLKEKLRIRKVRPKFARQRATHIKRISRSSYRAPKGLHSKMGDNKAGHKSLIKTGFGYPKALRGTDRTGRKIVHIHSLGDVAKATPADIVVISAKVGTRKKIQMLQALATKKIAVFHVKDASALATQLETEKKTTKEQKEKIAQSRKAAKEEALKKNQGKEAKKAEAPKDEKVVKEEQKKEHDKLLTKQQ
jgi:large subunit ribosomal protein L32e